MLPSRSFSLSIILLAASGGALAQGILLPSCLNNQICPTGPAGAACQTSRKANVLLCSITQPTIDAAVAAASGVYPKCVSSDDPGVSSPNPGAPYAGSTTSPADPNSNGTSASENGFTVKASARVCLNPAYAYNPTAPQMIFTCTAVGLPGSNPLPVVGVAAPAPPVNVHVDCGPQYTPGQDKRFPTPGYGAGNNHAAIYGLMAGRTKFNVNYSGITAGASVTNGFQMDISSLLKTP